MKIGRGSGAPVRILATKKPTTNEAGINCATTSHYSGIFAIVLVAIALLHVI